MKCNRIAAMFLSCMLQNIAVGAPKLPSERTQNVKGVFKNFDGEDYMYVNIEVAGKKESFYCLVQKCADWEQKESEFQGQIVELRIRTKKFYFKEMKQSREIREVLDLKTLKTKL